MGARKKLDAVKDWVEEEIVVAGFGVVQANTAGWAISWHARQEALREVLAKIESTP